MQAGAGPGETNNRPEPSRDGAALLHAAFDELATESGSQAGVDLDLHTTRELVELMNDGDATVPAVVRAAAAEIAAAVDAIVERLQRGGRLVYVGAGSSGRIATLDASECESTFSTRPGDVVAVIAGGHDASPLEQEAAEDDEDAGSAALRELDVSAADAVVALTASGRTPFVLGAARTARAAGALTVGIVSVPRSDLARVADHAIGVVVGPEFLAGSTRL
jgi:N-acetylmuramic acid 6-phosphate etherase